MDYFTSRNSENPKIAPQELKVKKNVNIAQKQLQAENEIFSKPALPRGRVSK
jgi:hypothetical protein